MKNALRGAVEKNDYLTGVYERSVLEDATRRYIAEKLPFSLLLVDVDNFKNINDGYGHAVGDKIIISVATMLKEVVGDRGAVGRFGGDEFIILVPDIVDYNEVWQFCHDIFAAIDGLSISEYPGIVITITLGLSRAPLDGGTYEILFEKADKALYRGKVKGRGCFIIYLDEKHKDIKLLSSKDTAINSMQLHNQIFKILTRRKNLADTIPSLIKFLSTNLMIDHLALQGKTKLLFSEVYPISKIKEFTFIENALIKPNISNSMGIFFVNDISKWKLSNQEKLRECIERQKIGSAFYAEISFGKTFYGYFRADTGDPCIWQSGKMDLLITAANAIGMMLHMQKIELDDLDSK